MKRDRTPRNGTELLAVHYLKDMQAHAQVLFDKKAEAGLYDIIPPIEVLPAMPPRRRGFPDIPQNRWVKTGAAVDVKLPAEDESEITVYYNVSARTVLLVGDCVDGLMVVEV